MRKTTALVMLGVLLSPAVWGQVPNLPRTPTEEGSRQLTGDRFLPEFTNLRPRCRGFLDGIVPLRSSGTNRRRDRRRVKDESCCSPGVRLRRRRAEKPVLAEETLFRPGSVSKLFTWTAVMQLAEQGRLDLDRDVNGYLDFKIPDAYGQPITLKNLLTHTAGFEEQVKDLFTPGPASPDLGDYVKTHIPERIFPPGTTPAYSNYGTALAGYVIERVSGRPFNQYIEENIFRPLGMTRSTFAQPLPPPLAPLMSNGYQLASDEPHPFETVGAFPAGSLSSTATDMARFIAAHLQGGQLNDARILRPETVSLMHSRLFALDPAANAMAYGFYEESRNGHRIIGHAGDTLYFHSDLHLIPDAGVGLLRFVKPPAGCTFSRTTRWARSSTVFPARLLPAGVGPLERRRQPPRSAGKLSEPPRRHSLKGAALIEDDRSPARHTLWSPN